MIGFCIVNNFKNKKKNFQEKTKKKTVHFLIKNIKVLHKNYVKTSLKSVDFEITLNKCTDFAEIFVFLEGSQILTAKFHQ